MSLHDRIKEARKNKGLTQEQLGELIGVAKTTVTGYEKNREPTAAKVGEIADALGVDVNFLFQDEVKELHENHATPEEFENIIKKYRLLDSHGQETVSYILDRELERTEQLEKAAAISQRPNTRIIQYFHKLASAGTGQFVFDDIPMEQIAIPDIAMYKHVDYAISIKGDSMEPLYQDGDVLLIDSDIQIEAGEIGVFLVDGKSYVKKLGDGMLISLNEDYGDIPLTEDSRYMGKVVGRLEI